MKELSLEPAVKAFEELTGVTVCLHIYNGAFYCGGRSLVDRRRRSHRQMHPGRCGMEQRSYCVNHCMHELNRRMAADPGRDLFAVHCRNGCFELVSPVYRNGRCVLTVFAGLLDPKEKEKVRRIARLLPLFAAGLESKACGLSLPAKSSRGTYAEKIQEFIEENYYKDISTADAAKAVHISVSRLCHILKENSLGTFSRMLTAERIYHARQLLAFPDPDLKLSEIASLCGFREYEHFSRTFKKVTGVSPARYRLQQG